MNEQQLPLPLIEVEEVLPDFYIGDLWSDALRRRAARRSQSVARSDAEYLLSGGAAELLFVLKAGDRLIRKILVPEPVAVPVTPPLSPMGGNSRSNKADF